MAMYHSWGSQNAWLRQIHGANRLYVAPSAASTCNIEDGDWVWVVSRTGRVRVQIQIMDGVNKDTVWTWNAIGKRKGAWNLDTTAPEVTRGFLLNHLIADVLPGNDGKAIFSNSDPITGQAAWYDLRVRLEKCARQEFRETAPQFDALSKPASLGRAPDELRYGAKRTVKTPRSNT